MTQILDWLLIFFGTIFSFYSFKRMTACHAIHLPLFSQITKMGDALFSYSTVCSTEKYLFCAISHFIYCI